MKRKHLTIRGNVMMLVKKSIVLATLMGCSISAMATVGGNTVLQMIGYEPKEKKVFVFHDFEDGLGGGKLYYFNLNAKNPTTLHEATSFYPNGEGGRAHSDDEGFNQKMANLKKRLVPLQPVASPVINKISINITSRAHKKVPYVLFDNRLVTQYHYQYQVKYGKYKSNTMKAVAYSPKMTVSQAFTIPQQNNVMVVAVKYLETLDEGGYTIEDPVLLLSQ